MTSRGWRGPASLVLAAALAAVLAAACGSAAAPAPSRHPVAVTVHGRLLRVHGATITVRENARAGSTRVTFAPQTTPIYRVIAATRADIQPGSCVVATGDRDAAGTLTARVIVVGSSANDACPPDAVPTPSSPAKPNPNPTPAPASPSPGAFPLPSPGPGPALLQGQVLSLGGGAIVVQGPEGDPVVVQLPHDLKVLFFAPADRSALVIPSCVVVHGTRSGQAVTANQIVDWPPDTGC